MESTDVFSLSYDELIADMELRGCVVTRPSRILRDERMHEFIIPHEYLDQLVEYFTAKGYPPHRHLLRNGPHYPHIVLYWYQQPRWAPQMSSYVYGRPRRYAGVSEEAEVNEERVAKMVWLQQQIVSLEKRHAEFAEELKKCQSPSSSNYTT